MSSKSQPLVYMYTHAWNHALMFCQSLWQYVNVLTSGDDNSTWRKILIAVFDMHHISKHLKLKLMSDVHVVGCGDYSSQYIYG